MTRFLTKWEESWSEHNNCSNLGCVRRTVTTTVCRMGQTRSDLAHSSSASNSGRATWRAEEKARRLPRLRNKGEPPNKNPMKNKVLACLGRRKRFQTEVEVGGGNEAADPASSSGHRVGKLPRDEVAWVVGEYQTEEPGCNEAEYGLECGDGRRSAAGCSAGPAAVSRLETQSSEVSIAGYEEPKPAREDNASDPPPRAMEGKPHGGSSQDCTVSNVGVLTCNNLSLAPILTSDPDPQQSLPSLNSEKRVDGVLSTPDDPLEAKMTKTDCSSITCRSNQGGIPNNCLTETQNSSDQILKSPPEGPRFFPGAIPKLIITRDPSPTRSAGTPDLLSVQQTELSSGSFLELHPDDESPCSDSGCGGSPALTRSFRKLSNSSSICLSSASSFEESEDDFTGSDIESSLSPARPVCSPDYATGVGGFVLTFSNETNKCWFHFYRNILWPIELITKHFQIFFQRWPQSSLTAAGTGWGGCRCLWLHALPETCATCLKGLLS